MNGGGGVGAPRRWGLRLRLGALCAGLGLAPFALALVLLYPVFRQEALQSQGESLAREARLLAQHVETRLVGLRDFRLAFGVVESFRRGSEGRALLLDAEGAVVAGLPGVPAPPRGAAAPGTHWFRFTAAGRDYLAAAVPLNAVPSVPSPSGARILAVLQPVSEFLAPVRAQVVNQGLFLIGFAAIAVVVAWKLTGRLLQPLRLVQQGAEIISGINLAHRLTVHTGDEFQDLAERFNRMAESLQGAYGELEARIRDTTRDLREERNRLVAVLRTMAEGVVMTNEAEEIVLITPSARLALGSGASSGMGAPLSSLLPPGRLAFHLKRLRRAWDKGQEAMESVVFPLEGGRLLPGLLSVVPGPGRQRAGFLLVFRDLGAEAEEEHTAAALRQVPELLKGPAVALRSIVDVLASRLDMEERRRATFLQAAQEEAARLTERLRGVEEAAAQAGSVRWPMITCDPRELLIEALADMPGAPLCVDLAEDEELTVLVEPYSWIEALGSIVAWLRSRSPGLPFEARLAAEDGSVVTTFRIDGPFPGDPSEVSKLAVAPAGEKPLALEEAVRRNRGELWCRRAGGALEVRMALLKAPSGARLPSRGATFDLPDFYDFDLFLPRSVVEPDEVLAAPLSDLEYVVFDTETTGLDPSHGDEVVSLSGVRVRNGKVAAADTFHAVVDPGRPIPPASTKFHGLDDAAVAGAPTLGEVLPQFRSFVGSAVLVAHNAAFDKKFLDLAAARYGLPALENPVLDTLFLSYGLHRDLEGHGLDSIAARLGVEIQGRHTSLGDARATAEILVKLLPLLEARGITTLADAKAFCDRMLLLRWQSSRF